MLCRRGLSGSTGVYSPPLRRCNPTMRRSETQDHGGLPRREYPDYHGVNILAEATDAHTRSAFNLDDHVNNSSSRSPMTSPRPYGASIGRANSTTSPAPTEKDSEEEKKGSKTATSEKAFLEQKKEDEWRTTGKTKTVVGFSRSHAGRVRLTTSQPAC